MINNSTTNYQNLPTIDAAASIAGTHLGTTGAKFDQVDPNAKIGAIENAVETGVAKLDQAQEIRQAISMAQQSNPQPSGLEPSGATAQIMKAGAFLGLGFMAPPAAAVAQWSPSPAPATPNNGVYEHAALVSGPSSFKSYTGNAKKGDDPAAQYTDVSGDTYTNGLKTAAPAMAQQQQRPGGPNPYLGAAGKALEGRDPNQLDKELGGAVTAEKKLIDQVVAGQDAALKEFGVQGAKLEMPKPVMPAANGLRFGLFG